VALLKDRNGVINLDLPVAGNLDDPDFKFGPILWDVLKNTLDKIVTAPFALLGRLFGGGEELAFVDFVYASAELTGDTKNKLDKLKVAMIERPALKLDVPLQVLVAADRAALARATLEQATTATKNADRLTALAAVYAKEFGKPPLYPEVADKNQLAAVRINFLEEILLAKFAPTPAQIDDLGHTRANAVRDALLASGEVSAERIFLSNRGSEAKQPKDSVRMELKIE
jgi:hypothetical protein